MESKFENFLQEKGYVRCEFIKGTVELKKSTTKHLLSTMDNIYYTYIHKDSPRLNYILNSKDDPYKEVPFDEINTPICYGLRERGKGPTLIHPKPKINVKRIIEQNNEKHIVNENEQYQDSMSLILQRESVEDIFEAIFNKSISFNVDLTY